MQDKKHPVRDKSAYDMLVITPLAAMALLWLVTYMTTPRVLSANEARETLGGVNPCSEIAHFVWWRKCGFLDTFKCDTWCVACDYKNKDQCEDTICWRCDHDKSITECVPAPYPWDLCNEFGGGAGGCGTKWGVECFWVEPTGPCTCPKDAEVDLDFCARQNCK
jgi:hypothetical protein